MMNQSRQETALSRAMILWSLTKATLERETATSWFYRVEQGDRRQAALRLLKPDAGEASAAERRSVALLGWYVGEGAVTVFDSSEDAIFVEWAGGVTLGEPARTGRDAEATEAFGHVAATLLRPRPEAPQGLMPLRQHFAMLFDVHSRHWPQTARDLLARSIGIAHGLFDKPTPIVPLHGNLHHDTIVMSDRGWLAIEPRGLLGDPVYEVAAAFINPKGAEALAADPSRVARLADSFSARLKFNRRRVLGFAAAHAALTACWALDSGKPIAAQIAILPTLLAAYDQA